MGKALSKILLQIGQLSLHGAVAIHFLFIYIFIYTGAADLA